MRPLTQKIEQAIRNEKLLKRGDTVVLGVSGGPDSVALVQVFLELRSAWGLKLVVVHINHQLRRGAQADAQFVKTLCAKFNIPCHIRKIRIKPSKDKSSVEEISREKRLAALIAIARQTKAQAIALGHHQDDLAETVLMRLLRGSGMAGMQAILPKREMHGVGVIRPMLFVTRAEILRFLKSGHYGFRHDPSNKQLQFFRNKIRLKLLPYLAKHYQPNVSELLANFALICAGDYAFLESAAKDAFRVCQQRTNDQKIISLKIKTLQDLPLSMQRMVLREAICRLKGSTRGIDRRHLQELEDLVWQRDKGAVVDLTGRIQVKKTAAVLEMKIISRRS